MFGKHNVEASIKGNTLTIEIDVSKDTLKKAPISKAGNSRLVATTRGFLEFNVRDQRLMLNINCVTDLLPEDGDGSE